MVQGRVEEQHVRSEEHTSELQSHGLISYAVFCLKKKNQPELVPKPIAVPDDPSSAAFLLVAALIFFFNDPAPTEIYTRPYTLSLHDALPISTSAASPGTSTRRARARSRPPTRSEEHTSELQSHGLISYAVFCLKKKKKI